MPLILTPTILSVVLNLMLRMERYKTALEEEIEKTAPKICSCLNRSALSSWARCFRTSPTSGGSPLNAINLTLLSLRLAHATGKLGDNTLEQAFETIE
ncbi:MAG: hypothetical protein IE886_01455 [Campylobacterales bacterium]|nr:hypothetical protein [Campylobacterales bacterium]